MKHSGKSSIGRRVAARLGRPFIDLDAEIEALDEREHGTARSVRTIYADSGETEFRRLEAAACAAVRPGAIVATGGGICDNQGALAAMADGLRLFLDDDCETLCRRIFAKGIPAFLDTRDKEEARSRFRALYARRTAIYRRLAVMTADLRGLDLRAAVLEVTRRIEELTHGGK